MGTRRWGPRGGDPEGGTQRGEPRGGNPEVGTQRWGHRSTVGPEDFLDRGTGCCSWEGKALSGRDLATGRAPRAIPGFLLCLCTAGPSRTRYLHPPAPGALRELPHDHLARHRLCLQGASHGRCRVGQALPGHNPLSQGPLSTHK